MRIVYAILITVMLTFLVLAGAPTGLAEDDVPPQIPTTPTPVPPPPPSYSPPVYSPPPFERYVVPVLSSDGRAIGNLTGVDYNTVKLYARSAENEGGWLELFADLGSRPPNPVIDISFAKDGPLPEGMNDVTTLISASVTGEGLAGWAYKAGTTKLAFGLPSALPGSDGQAFRCYLIRQGGDGYQIVNASLAEVGGNWTAEVTVPSIVGTFTLVLAREPRPTATPAPTPQPTPEPTATPVPTASPTPVPPAGLAGYMPLAAAFGGGILIGAIAFLAFTRLL